MNKESIWPLIDIVALSLVRGMSSVNIRYIVSKRRSLEHCLESPPGAQISKILSGDLFSKLSVDDMRGEASTLIHHCQMKGTSIISIVQDAYPKLLKEIAYPPALIFVRGQIAPADALALGVVGTRRCTQYGRHVCERFSSECAEAGIEIVSGLANGIDTFAHEATLKVKGRTIAVIASGVDCIGPSHAAHLASRIVDAGGAIISEYANGTRALPVYFPQRNRIISGLSRAVLVVESGLRGGSLITAGFAFDQGREVYAVPGMITSERSEGTNMLIAKQQASVALSPRQIMQDLGLSVADQAVENKVTFDSELERRVYGLLDAEAKHVDELSARLNVPSNELLVALLMLEFRGYVRQLAGKLFLKT